MRRAAAILAGTLAVAVVLAGQAPLATLTGFAVLPADTFADGPPSGAWRGRANGGRPEFGSQPVQGFSSIRPSGTGWLALADNGFGTRLNSADALLRFYELRVDWGTAGPRPGAVRVERVVTIADPGRHWPWRLVRDGTRERWLTGGDLDPESFVRMPDGTFWVGDEFGPFLVHIGADARLLGPPLGPPGLRSPDHPALDGVAAGEAPNVTRSRGFEGLAYAPASGMLLAALEAGPAGDPPGTTRILEVDPVAGTFRPGWWEYRFDAAGDALTEFVSLEEALGTGCAGRYLAVERDNGHGPDAVIKRVYEVTLPPRPADGAVAAAGKRLVADLMDIANPEGLGGFGARFTFPFITPESVWPVDRGTLVLVDDNNYPAGGARPGYVRDPSEFIRLRLAAPLACGG
ncbi:MAG: esterase-like activity of phytase family protein [Vicinamibacterales bacterium]